MSHHFSQSFAAENGTYKIMEIYNESQIQRTRSTVELRVINYFPHDLLTDQMSHGDPT